MILRGNWQAVNKYLKYRSEVDQVSHKTVRLEKTWLRHLLLWADDNPFIKAPTIRPTFPQYVISGRLDGSEKAFSQVYITKVIGTAKRFFDWLSKHQSGFSFIRFNYLDTLKSPRMETKPQDHEAVTKEEIIAIAKAPVKTLMEERIQAAAVLWFLSGIRIGAFVSLPIKAVDIENRTIMLWPSLGVKTKFSKHSTVYLLEIPELLEVVAAWDYKIKQILKPDDFWFAPLSTVTYDFELNYQESGKYRSDGARKDLKAWLHEVGIKYHSPHKFRHGHAVYGLKRANTFSEFKAVSQNLSHASINTTDQIYSILSENDVKERIAGFGYSEKNQHGNLEDDKLQKIWEILNE